jgi:hypothetical protein
MPLAAAKLKNIAVPDEPAEMATQSSIAKRDSLEPPWIGRRVEYVESLLLCASAISKKLRNGLGGEGRRCRQTNAATRTMSSAPVLTLLGER